MEYPKRTRNGDAGEYFAAFKISKLLQWPVRLLDVDLGVDGEVEILDQKGVSTSDLVKLQIKTFDEITPKESQKIYVSPEHIDYWKKFCLPIVIVCVDLKNETIYWKPVVATESYASSGKSNVISIDLTKDKLTAASNTEFAALVSPEQSKNIEALLQTARLQRKELQGDIFDISWEELEKIEKRCNSLEQTLSQIDEIARHFPWRIGLLMLKEVADMRQLAKRQLRDAEMSHRAGGDGM